MLTVVWAATLADEEEEGLANPGFNDSVAVPDSYIVEFNEDIGDGGNFLEAMYNAGFEAEIEPYDSSGIFAHIQIYGDQLDNLTVVEFMSSLPEVAYAWEDRYVLLADTPSAGDQPIWNPHVVTHVDELHKKGIKGKGVTVAILDTGIDYKHEALGGGIGPAFKVISGQSFVNDKNPTNDVLDEKGHGTFVASIVAGESDRYVGVAPEAKIRFYKVFQPGPKGKATSNSIVAALFKAKDDGVDVINMSIGRPMSSYIGLVQSRVTLQITVLHNIPIVQSAGNEGRQTCFQAQWSFEPVIHAGSVVATEIIQWPATAVSSSGETFDFLYMAGGDKLPSTGSFPVEWVPKLCNYNGAVGNRFLVGAISDCNTKSIVTLTYYQQFKGILGFQVTPNYISDSVNFAISDYGTRDWISNQISRGNTVSIRLDKNVKPVVSELPNAMAGKMDPGSTWGPTFRNRFYPSVLAPGGLVLGAALGTGYRVLSGTSFSAPYIAGVIALYLSQHKGASVSEIRNKLLSTASFVPSQNDDSYIEPLMHQGAGMINARKFLETSIELTSAPLLSWGDVRHREYHGTIKFKNNNLGGGSTRYYVTHHPTIAVEARASNGAPSKTYPPTVKEFALASIRETSLDVWPGNEAEVFFSLWFPKGQDHKKAVAWLGYFKIEDGNSRSINVPYMGVETDTYLWDPLAGKPSYSPALRGKKFKKNEFPTVSYTLNYGTDVYSFDIVKDDFKFENIKAPFYETKGYVSALRGISLIEGPFLKDGSYGFPYEHTQFGPVQLQFTGRENRKALNPGYYRILTRALRTYGRVTQEADWQYYLSDVFNYQVEPKELPLVDISSSSETSSTISSTTSSVDSSRSWSSLSIGGWHNSSISEPVPLITKPDPVTTPDPVVTPDPLKPKPSIDGVTVIDGVTIIDHVTVIDGVRVTKSCTTGCKPGPKITTTTITKCSDGGCERETITIGDKSTVQVTVTTCLNNVCGAHVTLVVEQLVTTLKDGHQEVYTSTKQIALSSSTRTTIAGVQNSSGAVGLARLILMLLLSYLVTI